MTIDPKKPFLGPYVRKTLCEDGENACRPASLNALYVVSVVAEQYKLFSRPEIEIGRYRLDSGKYQLQLSKGVLKCQGKINQWQSNKMFGQRSMESLWDAATGGCGPGTTPRRWKAMGDDLRGTKLKLTFPHIKFNPAQTQHHQPPSSYFKEEFVVVDDQNRIKVTWVL